MAIELSNLTFSEQDDIVPASGVEEILINTGIANTLAGDDILNGDTGNIDNISIPDTLSGISNTGTLNTNGGNDILTGISKNLSYYDWLEGNGIYNEGTIDTSDGDDIITGINQKDYFGYFAGIRQRYRSAIINTGNGDDIITGISRSIGRGIDNAFGSIINTGDGNDTITGNGYEAGITNVYGSIINTGNGNDIIIGDGNSGLGSPFNKGIYNLETIDTGDGNDTIIGAGTEGISNPDSTINTGNGEDSIISQGKFYNSGGVGGVFLGDGNDSIIATDFLNLAIENFYGIIDTGEGNDIISGAGLDGISNINGTINTGNSEDFIISQGKFFNSGNVFLGEGNDSITTADTDFPNRALENFNFMGTGDGNDTITSTGVLYNEGVIETGNGDDSIVVNATGIGYGIYNNGGAINMGDGNDSIIANEGFESGSNSSGAWFLGEGEDYIKGYGSGDFYGGNGNDTLELTPGTYTVGIWGEGWDTSAIFTNGNQLMITSEFERLKAGSTIYDFTSLTAGQIIVVA